MSRKRLILTGLLVVGLVVGVVLLFYFGGGESNSSTIPALTDRVQERTEAAQPVFALRDNIWIPRVGGLGLGLTAGLLVGGTAAYLRRGEIR